MNLPLHHTHYMRKKKRQHKRHSPLTINALVVTPDYLPRPQLEPVPPERVISVIESECQEGEEKN